MVKAGLAGGAAIWASTRMVQTTVNSSTRLVTPTPTQSQDSAGGPSMTGISRPGAAGWAGRPQIAPASNSPITRITTSEIPVTPQVRPRTASALGPELVRYCRGADRAGAGEMENGVFENIKS